MEKFRYIFISIYQDEYVKPLNYCFTGEIVKCACKRMFAMWHLCYCMW